LRGISASIADYTFNAIIIRKPANRPEWVKLVEMDGLIAEQQLITTHPIMSNDILTKKSAKKAKSLYILCGPAHK